MSSFDVIRGLGHAGVPLTSGAICQCSTEKNPVSWKDSIRFTVFEPRSALQLHLNATPPDVFNFWRYTQIY